MQRRPKESRVDGRRVEKHRVMRRGVRAGQCSKRTEKKRRGENRGEEDRETERTEGGKRGVQRRPEKAEKRDGEWMRERRRAGLV